MRSPETSASVQKRSRNEKNGSVRSARAGTVPIPDARDKWTDHTLGQWRNSDRWSVKLSARELTDHRPPSTDHRPVISPHHFSYAVGEISDGLISLRPPQN